MYQDNYFLGATDAEIAARTAADVVAMQAQYAPEYETDLSQYAANMQARAEAIAAAEYDAQQDLYAANMQARAQAIFEAEQAQIAANLQARAEAIAAARDLEAQQAATAAEARQMTTAEAVAAQAQAMEARRSYIDTTPEGKRMALQNLITTMRGMGYTVILRTPGGV
jgi:hypothetical protein